MISHGYCFHGSVTMCTNRLDSIMTAPVNIGCVYSRDRLYAWCRLWMENRNNNNNKLPIDVETFNTLCQLRILRYRGSRGGRRKQKQNVVRITRYANHLPALHVSPLPLDASLSQAVNQKMLLCTVQTLIPFFLIPSTS